MQLISKREQILSKEVKQLQMHQLFLPVFSLYAKLGERWHGKINTTLLSLHCQQRYIPQALPDGDHSQDR